MSDATATETAPGEAAAARGRAFWQRLPVLLAVGVAPVPFGFYFMGFIAMAMLLSDRTRDVDARAGGTVALFWWSYMFRQGDTSPYLSVVLLAVAGTLFARSALARRRGTARGPAWVPAGAVLGLAACAVAGFVPYGYRGHEVGREEAVHRVVEERAARPWRGIGAEQYLAERGRLRLVHKPVWYVALYEPHPTIPATADRQPCFARREVWRVDGLTGAVSRATYDEAHAGGDPCLPVRAGTASDLRPLPG